MYKKYIYMYDIINYRFLIIGEIYRFFNMIVFFN